MHSYEPCAGLAHWPLLCLLATIRCRVVPRKNEQSGSIKYAIHILYMLYFIYIYFYIFWQSRVVRYRCTALGTSVIYVWCMRPHLVVRTWNCIKREELCKCQTFLKLCLMETSSLKGSVCFVV